MDTLSKVKAEIERLKREELVRNDIGVITGKAFTVDADKLLSFIDSLEKQEQPTIKGWVARDKDKQLCCFFEKPKRMSNAACSGFWFNENPLVLREDAFPDLKWEDESIEVELTINRL